MKLSTLLLKFLKSNKSNYRELKKILLSDGEAKDYVDNVQDQSIRNTLWRLKKKGLLSQDDGTWELTREGRKFLDEKEEPLPFFNRKTSAHPTRRIICMFDIPEDERYKRDWLRSQLELLDFSKLQNSVWIGAAPLPEALGKYLEETSILPYVRFLEVTKENLI